MQDAMGYQDQYKQQQRAAKMDDMTLAQHQARLDAEKRAQASAEQRQQIAAEVWAGQNGVLTPPGMGAGLDARTMGSLPPEMRTPLIGASPGLAARPNQLDGASMANFYRTLGGRMMQAGQTEMADAAFKSAETYKPKTQTVAPGASVIREGANGAFETAFTAPDKPEALPSSVKEYQFGKTDPGFNAWNLANNSAKGTRINLPKMEVNMGAQESEQSKAYGKSIGEQRAAINSAAFTAPQQLAKLDRMEQLLANVDGGKFAPMGKELASAAQSAFGIKLDPNLGNKEGAQALAVEMALAMRKPGSGATSDKDFDNWLATVPDLSKTKQGRAEITSTMRSAAKRDIEIGKMSREYARSHNGVIDDTFFDQIADHVAKNPVVQRAPAPSKDVNNLVEKYRSK
jgi:hypothetical protein